MSHPCGLHVPVFTISLRALTIIVKFLQSVRMSRAPFVSA